MVISWQIITTIISWFITITIVVFKAGQLTKDLVVMTREVEQMRAELRADLERLRAELHQVSNSYNDRMRALERDAAAVGAMMHGRGNPS